MNMQRDPREALPRAAEGALALNPQTRGRSTAPLLSLWLPLAVKAAAVAGIALILAVIGAKAGAHRPPPAPEPAPSAGPAVVAANLIGLPAGVATNDAGSQGESPGNASALTAREQGPPGDPGASRGASAGAPRELGGHGDDTFGTAAAAAEGDGVGGDAILPDGRVVLNLASEAELTKLPGVGPSRARAILALRQRLSKFRAVEDLLRIKGIGRKMLRRLRPSVVLDRPAVDPSGAPASLAAHPPPGPIAAP